MNKALFLDRDGVINIDRGYISTMIDFTFSDGIFEFLRYFQEKKYIIIVVTNQSGIGRGYYSEECFNELTHWMKGVFKQKDIEITKVYYCPFHATLGLGAYKKASYCRKPNPGMILAAAKEYSICLRESILIGDKESDIEAAVRAGIEQTFLFVSDEKKVVFSKASNIVSELKEVIKIFEKR